MQIEATTPSTAKKPKRNAWMTGWVSKLSTWVPWRCFPFTLMLTFLVFSLNLGTSPSLAQDTWSTETAPTTENDGDLLDDFDGVRTSMRLVASKSLVKVRRHHRSDQSPFRGRRSEFISVLGARGGERILAVQDIEPVASISELEFGARVRGNRVGFQLMARVRLPRSLNDDGEPIAIYVLGDRYSSPNNWERLTVSGFENQVENQVRAMRVDAGYYVESAEAYVDQVAINVYGGADSNSLSIDDLTASAAVPIPKRDDKIRQANHLANYQTPLTLSLPTKKAWKHPNWIPRVVRHQGEAFSELKNFGFNTIWLADPATREQLDMAAKLQIELVCPPTNFDEGAKFSHVAAWYIPSETTYSAQQIATIRESTGRPILSDAIQIADIQLSNDSLEPHSVNKSSASRWIDTSTGGSLRWMQIRESLRAAVFAGQSGFVFDPGPLAHRDASYANAVAQLFNLELSILRPWILRYQTNEPLRPSIRHPDFEVRGMASRHAGLIWVSAKAAEGLQIGNRSSSDITIDLPDAQYRDMYHIEPGSLEPARDRRIPGGIRVTLNHDKPDGLLLMSSHPKILQAHKEHLQRIAKDYNKLLITVIRHEMLELDRQLEASIPDPKLVGHLRHELQALRGRITPVLESRERLVTYRQLDHVLGQIERVQQLIADRF